MAKDGKKGGGGKVAGGVAVGAVAAAAVFLFLKGGDLGLPWAKGSNDNKPAETTAAVTTTAPEAEPAVTEVKYVDVTIKEDKYVYNGGEYDLEGLVTELKKLTGGENVRINDDGGLAEALDSLKKALDENGIKYSDETAK
jgi:hypothetical protein